MKARTHYTEEIEVREELWNCITMYNKHADILKLGETYNMFELLAFVHPQDRKQLEIKIKNFVK